MTLRRTVFAATRGSVQAEAVVVSISVKCLVIGMPAGSVEVEDYPSTTVRAIEPAALPGCRHLFGNLEVIVAPLFGSEFDALEMMEQLAELGYRGTVRVIAPHLPSRQIVLRELRSHAARQGLLIELIEQPAPHS